MLRPWKIARAFGIDIYLHWSFVLLFALIVWQLNPKGLVPILLTLLLVPVLLTCVLLHEYGHALTARAFGIGTRDITLYPLGGVARLERMSEKPLEEIIISVAGPAVNVAIAMILLVVVVVVGPSPTEEMAGLAPTNALHFLLITLAINIGLVGFNMIPAFPMDGGRVFRAFLALFMSRIRATKIAVVVGIFFAGLFLLAPFFGKSPILWLVGIFIPLAGMMELAMLQRQAAERQRLQELAESYPVVEEWEPPTEMSPPEPNFSGYTWNPQFRVWVEWRGGWPVRSCRMRGL
jgi:Zn-dependent protease